MLTARRTRPPSTSFERQILANGAVNLVVVSLVNGVETQLASTTVAGLTYAANDQSHAQAVRERLADGDHHRQGLADRIGRAGAAAGDGHQLERRACRAAVRSVFAPT